jgi:hypothetical protein
MISLSELKLDFQQQIENDLRAARLAAGDKNKQRDLLLKRKAEIVATQQGWIDSHRYLLDKYCRTNLPDDYVPNSLRLVLCREQWQHDLWRIVKLTYWSMPPNEYVGRRKRILVFDGDYLFGLIGLASCIWGLTARDKWIGWNVHQKTEKVDYVVDAYVLGAVPPYNGRHRGSKLLAYLVASNEVRDIWKTEYGFSPAVVVTTTLFGHSAVLNRVRHNGARLWHRVGYTRGLGTMHFSLETIRLAKELLSRLKINVPDRLNSGPNWKLRLMRTAIESVDFPSEEYLEHGYKRGIYLMEYAKNTRQFLRGNGRELDFYGYSIEELMESWQRYHSKPACG